MATTKLKKQAAKAKLEMAKTVNEFVKWFYDGDCDESLEDSFDRMIPSWGIGVFELGDMYLNVDDIWDCLHVGATPEEFRSWYWSFEQEDNGKRKYGLRYFVALKRGEA